jgi:hypothetical protein
VPGWHAKTKQLVADGKLKVLGIVEEQHADRAVLFMEWQQMDWPVLSDPLNLLGVYAIPYTFLIDEHGIIRYKNPTQAEFESFLTTKYQAAVGLDRPEISIEAGSAEHAIMWGGEAAISSAIEQLEQRTVADPSDEKAFFRLGVAYRKRHDSPERQPGDFSKAVGAWQQALELNPQQYIWRRRIQQYGPRLDKPYSFYDWVNEARTAITNRGGTPHQLSAEPGGSEFAHPGQADASQAASQHPDPQGKLPRDQLGLVQVEAIAVSSTDRGKPAYRVHLRFRPSKELKVHWTNDAGRLSFFPADDPAVVIHDRQPDTPLPQQPATNEERSIEFEIRPAAGKQLPASLEGSAFYYVCEDVNGGCQYLRQDIVIRLE